LIVLTVIGLIVGLGLAAAIVAVPVMAEKGPLRTTLVADLGGGQEVQGGGDPDGRGRARGKEGKPHWKNARENTPKGFHQLQLRF
jgi:hypothetical protein